MASKVKLDSRGRLVLESLETIPSIDECEQAVADLNFSAIKNLVNSFAKLRHASGRSVPEVARILGAPEDMVHQIESGNYGLSLDELSEYLYAINAVCSFRVAPNARTEVYSALVKKSSMRKAKNMWVEHKPAPSNEITTRSVLGLAKGVM